MRLSGPWKTCLAFVCVVAFFAFASASLYLALISLRGWAGGLFGLSLLPLAVLAFLMREDRLPLLLDEG